MASTEDSPTHQWVFPLTTDPPLNDSDLYVTYYMKRYGSIEYENISNMKHYLLRFGGSIHTDKATF